MTIEERAKAYVNAEFNPLVVRLAKRTEEDIAYRAFLAGVKENAKLFKAKDLLLRFIELKNKPCAVGHSVNMLLYENICADVKQFLKEVEE